MCNNYTGVICKQLQLLGAHHILHVSRIKVKDNRVRKMNRKFGTTVHSCTSNTPRSRVWQSKKNG
jgi:hypothetical protein